VALAARGSDINHTVFVGETVAVLAPGFSWFLKGSELFNILREEHGLPPMLRPAGLNEPTSGRRPSTPRRRAELSTAIELRAAVPLGVRLRAGPQR